VGSIRSAAVHLGVTLAACGAIAAMVSFPDLGFQLPRPPGARTLEGIIARADPVATVARTVEQTGLAESSDAPEPRPTEIVMEPPPAQPGLADFPDELAALIENAMHWADTTEPSVEHGSRVAYEAWTGQSPRSSLLPLKPWTVEPAEEPASRHAEAAPADDPPGLPQPTVAPAKPQPTRAARRSQSTVRVAPSEHTRPTTTRYYVRDYSATGVSRPMYPSDGPDPGRIN